MQAQNTIESDAAKLDATRAALGERAATVGTAIRRSLETVPANGIGIEFLSNLAHQLRSPLSSLRVWVDLLSDPAAFENPDSMKRLVDGIDRATTRLERQITDVLEVGYMEAGTLSVETEPVDATEQLLLAVSDTEQAARSRRVAVDLKFGDQFTSVIADSARLRQLIGCFLSNAIKYSPVGGTVTVTTGAAARIARDPAATTVLEPQFEGRAQYVCISDGGPGLDQELHDEVFKPFHKASRKNAYGGGGSGLGLAIAAGLLRLQRGGMWLRSGLNSGADFEFSLSQADQAQAVHALATAPQDSEKGPAQ